MFPAATLRVFFAGSGVESDGAGAWLRSIVVPSGPRVRHGDAKLPPPNRDRAPVCLPPAASIGMDVTELVDEAPATNEVPTPMKAAVSASSL